ncbi:DUF4003 family protein [Bacillus sp. FJAT-42376]|uniref:DUF4003 family protein n=1 Tax=Bacillus sp. FJAT-42376 TaxID=2014076 RepID=UPI000F50E279|nr:DUF4003 family protein [Bacillus sp. FJAT-42376]AZB44373.1 DUF4003 family protein [Bacillus sp. FJAT-42376]
MEYGQHKLDQYHHIFLQLKDELKWKVADQRILMMAASLYAVSNRAFNLSHYLHVCDYMKAYSGMFSPFKSYHRFITAAILDTRYEDPFAKFDEMHRMHDMLVHAGFRKGIFTYISALALMGTNTAEDKIHVKAAKAHTIYSYMKDQHFFLTSASDYPLAVLLAEREERAEELIELMESYYDELNRSGFKQGNELQFLSHILSLTGQAASQDIVSRCVQTARTLEDYGFSLKRKHYPEIGLLSLINSQAADFETLFSFIKKLNGEKHFKWHKDMNFTVAVHLIASDRLENSSLIGTGLYTSIEIMMQAQQAAMIAVVASSAASSDGGGGGD